MKEGVDGSACTIAKDDAVTETGNYEARIKVEKRA
jgi:hypothetical protein